MTEPTLRYQVADGIARITLCRPKLFNRMDMEAHDEFEEALYKVHLDPTVRVVLIEGEGKHFSAGGDMAEVGRLQNDPARLRRMFHKTRQLVGTLVNIEVPVIAAVQGEAVGLGASIAALSDIIVVAPDSGITDPHAAIGLTPGDGGCIGMPLAMGLTRAKRYLLTGERIPGDKAYDFGLATDLVESREQIVPAAEKIAAKIAALPPISVRGAKRALTTYTNTAMGIAFDMALASEEQAMMSADAREALAAFMEKRKPVFKGE
jgi:enoyl-CoA hydratase